MSTVDFLLVLSVLADPAPYAGYGWRVEEQLAAHDRAVEALRSAEYGTPEWWDAEIARAGVEARLADLFGVEPRPRPALDFDDHFLFFA